MKFAFNKRKVRMYKVIIGALIMSFASAVPFGAQAVHAEETTSEIISPITKEDAVNIFEGKITLEDGRADSSLTNREKPLDPEADDDGDGIKNNEELFTITKNGKKYLYYKTHPLLEDTDGDGIKDGEDSEPLKWDVSTRDAILFQELGYRDDDYIKHVLDHRMSGLIKYEDREEYSIMRRELSPYWELQESVHDTYNGFDSALFKFSNKKLPFLKDGEVHVLAFRGTSGDGDRGADMKIAFNLWPDQAYTALFLADKFNSNQDKYKNVYVTGHSLGGYLAQVFFVDSVGGKYHARSYKKMHTNPQIKKVYTFNAPKVNYSIANPWGRDFSNIGDQVTLDYGSKHYRVANDSITKMKGAFWNNITLENSERGHSSRSFFEDRYIDQPGFSIGNRRGLSGEGYEQDAIKKMTFAKPTIVEYKDGEKTVSSKAIVKEFQYEINSVDFSEYVPEGYEMVSIPKIKIGEKNTIEIRNIKSSKEEKSYEQPENKESENNESENSKTDIIKNDYKDVSSVHEETIYVK